MASCPEPVTVWTRTCSTWDAGAEMSAEVVTGAERKPRRARYLLPRGLPRRGEILAACVLLIVLGHVLFGQLTMVLAAAFYLITKMTRWRLSWLMIPAAAGVAWTIAVGPRTAAAGFAEGPAQVARYLGGWLRRRGRGRRNGFAFQRGLNLPDLFFDPPFLNLIAHQGHF